MQRRQFNDGEEKKHEVKLYKLGSKELKADLLDAIDNWKNIFGAYFQLDKIDLNVKSGILLDLRADKGDEYEIWEII